MRKHFKIKEFTSTTPKRLYEVSPDMAARFTKYLKAVRTLKE